MRWTIENEELLLSLYFEVKTRYEKKMKKDVKRCKWIAGKLRDEAKLDYSTTLVAKLNIMKMAESPRHSGVVDSTEAFLDENLDEKSIAQILRES